MRFDATLTPPAQPITAVVQFAEATPAKPKGFGFTLGGKTATIAPAKSGKYPILPDPDKSLAAIATDIKVQTEQYKALEGSLERNRKLLVEKARPMWFKINAGKGTVESSVVVDTGDGSTIMVSFQERFGQTQEPERITEIIGDDAMKAHFRPAFEFKVDCNALPEGDETQALLNDVYSLFEQRGVTAAIKFTSTVKPRKGFNDIRHSLFSTDQNLALDQVCPIIAAVKTTGREGK